MFPSNYCTDMNAEQVTDLLRLLPSAASGRQGDPHQRRPLQPLLSALRLSCCYVK